MNSRHVVVVGVGNIGSHLVPHLGRMTGLAGVTLVDRDRYDESNLAGQDITRGDVGRPKVRVQAARLRRINPSLAVRAVAAGVEELPLGLLRADALLGCVDSRAARQTLNEATRRLGVAWIDAGVQGTGWLARVSVYPPDARAACLECGWDQRDYDLLEQAYPCTPGARVPPPTRPVGAGGAGRIDAGARVPGAAPRREIRRFSIFQPSGRGRRTAPHALRDVAAASPLVPRCRTSTVVD